MKASRIAIRRVNGRFPAWLWRELHTANREAGEDVPVLIVDDGPHPLVIFDLDHYNQLVTETSEPFEVGEKS